MNNTIKEEDKICKCEGCGTKLRKSKKSRSRAGYCWNCFRKGHDISPVDVQRRMHVPIRFSQSYSAAAPDSKIPIAHLNGSGSEIFRKKRFSRIRNWINRQRSGLHRQ